jgi:hypothetical protein
MLLGRLAPSPLRTFCINEQDIPTKPAQHDRPSRAFRQTRHLCSARHHHTTPGLRSATKNEQPNRPASQPRPKNIRIPGETTRRTVCQHGDTPASGGGQTASRGWQSYIDRVAVTARSGKSAVDQGLRQGREDNDKVPKYRGELYATAPEEDVTGKESDQVVELVPGNFFIYV